MTPDKLLLRNRRFYGMSERLIPTYTRPSSSVGVRVRTRAFVLYPMQPAQRVSYLDAETGPQTEDQTAR